jgi:hypothetical protein
MRSFTHNTISEIKHPSWGFRRVGPHATAIDCDSLKLAPSSGRKFMTPTFNYFHWFDPGSVHVGFVVDKVALGQVFHRVLRFSPVNFILTVLHYLEK